MRIWVPVGILAVIVSAAIYLAACAVGWTSVYPDVGFFLAGLVMVGAIIGIGFVIVGGLSPAQKVRRKGGTYGGGNKKMPKHGLG